MHYFALAADKRHHCIIFVPIAHSVPRDFASCLLGINFSRAFRIPLPRYMQGMTTPSAEDSNNSGAVGNLVETWNKGTCHLHRICRLTVNRNRGEVIALKSCRFMDNYEHCCGHLTNTKFHRSFNETKLRDSEWQLLNILKSVKLKEYIFQSLVRYTRSFFNSLHH